MRHLDQLLSIKSLKAIEWTPEAGKPGEADPCRFPMYRKILEAGKSVQIVYFSQPITQPGLKASTIGRTAIMVQTTVA